MSKLSKALLINVMVIAVCVALFAGTTFAWFTDEVTSTGNTIVAGNLEISATYADVAQEGTSYAVTDENLKALIGTDSLVFGAATELTGSNAIISESSWEPGSSNAKLLTVTNAGDINLKIKLYFDITDGSELTGALWYDFMQIENGAISGQFTQREMSTIEALGQATPAIEIKPAESVSFILVYGMNTSADNQYQEKSFECSVKVYATQIADDTSAPQA